MKKLLLSLTLLLLAFPASAAWTRANLFGADVRSIVVDPASPDTLWLGTSHGEVYVSRDGAATWSNPWGGVPFPATVVDNLVIDGKGRLWAACWGLWGGGVIAVSTDGGTTWTRRDAGLEDFSVRAIAASAGNPDELVIGGLTGVWQTRDAGSTWKQIGVLENVESIAIDPRTSDRIYAGTWRQAFRTENGGKDWKLVNQGMVLDTDVFSIVINPVHPDQLWLSTCGWVYSSKDRGDNWTRYKDGFNNRRIHTVELDVTKGLSVYAGSVAGLYRTPDAGKSWQLLTDESYVINAIALHPERPDRIILGTEGDGIYVSKDRGKSFVRSSQGLYNVRVVSVVVDPAGAGGLWAAVVSGRTSSGIYYSADKGASWSRKSRTLLPEIRSFVAAEEGSPRFVVGTEKGIFWSEDGVDWNPAEPSTLPLRSDRILAYNKSRFFAAMAEGVFTSKDGGRNWSKLGELSGRVRDIAIGSFSGQVALFALGDGTIDIFDGRLWRKVEGGPVEGASIAIMQGDDALIVAGANGVRFGRIDAVGRWRDAVTPNLGMASVHRTGDSIVLSSRNRADLFVSPGRLGEWKTIGLPERSLDILSVATDPRDQSRLYVGTGGQGILIYRGFDAVRGASVGAAAASATGTK